MSTEVTLDSKQNMFYFVRNVVIMLAVNYNLFKSLPLNCYEKNSCSYVFLSFFNKNLDQMSICSWKNMDSFSLLLAFSKNIFFRLPSNIFPATLLQYF